MEAVLKYFIDEYETLKDCTLPEEERDNALREIHENVRNKRFVCFI